MLAFKYISGSLIFTPAVTLSEKYALASNNSSLNDTSEAITYGTTNMSTGTTNETHPGDTNGTITYGTTNTNNITKTINSNTINQ